MQCICHMCAYVYIYIYIYMYIRSQHSPEGLILSRVLKFTELGKFSCKAIFSRIWSLGLHYEYYAESYFPVVTSADAPIN